MHRSLNLEILSFVVSDIKKTKPGSAETLKQRNMDNLTAEVATKARIYILGHNKRI